MNMKLICPINIKKSSLKLPFIFECDDKKITIEKFSNEEKEKVFGIDGLKITNGRIHCKKIEPSHNNPLICYQEFILSTYKIIIEGKTDNPYELQKLQCELEFAFKIIMGRDFPITKYIDKDKSIYNNSISHSNRRIISKKNNELDLNKIERIEKITGILINKETNEIKNLKEFFNIAIYATNISISCAFYITILDSIFASDQASSYALIMRMTKKRNGNEECRETIKKLYKERCNVFHGNTNGYNKKDKMFLEEEVALVIEEFFKNPKLFEPKELDKLLLN